MRGVEFRQNLTASARSASLLSYADRRHVLAAVLFCGLALLAFLAMSRAPVRAQDDNGFRTFVASLWPDAARHGVSRATFDAATAGLAPDPTVIAHSQKQAEFVKPIADYLASAVSDERIAKGRGAVGDWQQTLGKIEAAYGVDRYTLLGVWGMESNFGAFTGNNNVIRALATLANSDYKPDYFKGELITALRILEERHIALADMTGSWAGAMGQTQFMPSSFMKYAVDFAGDGHKNIWTSVPDALASTANYLASHGWIRDYTWGYEALAPRDADLAHASATTHGFAAFARAGFRRADGGVMPTVGEAELILPAGADGPAFLVTKNFNVIKTYNNSTAYALGVGLLSDRIAGAAPLLTPWPDDRRASLVP
ncbi:MAG TPA: lytic murein transglycosylase [Beijerinckiaceae bacterium]|nr:lytic murein transglycosylase [Beijerinckiaceae bacterium]